MLLLPVCIAEVAHFILELSPSSPVPPEAIVPLTTAGYALPLCTNVMTTGLIVYKIWRATHFGLGPSGEVLQSTSRVARSAMSIIVESGVLYLAAQLVFVVLVNVKHPAQAIVAVMAVQIYVSSRRRSFRFPSLPAPTPAACRRARLPSRCWQPYLHFWRRRPTTPVNDANHRLFSPRRASRRRSSSFGLVSVSRLRLRKRLCRQVRSRGLRAVRCSLQGITPMALARQGQPRLKQRMGLRSS